jgi:polyketide biosynthesis enoyl-CoA hydratase PksI
MITYERDEDGVAVIHMNDTEGRNALSEAFVTRLYEVLAEAAADQEAKVCIIRGLSDVFCAGADKEILLELADGDLAPTDLMLSRAVLEIPVPTIAAVEGHAVGGGLTMAVCCDMFLLARESRYGCSFMNMGFTPGMGTTRLLQAAFGEFVASEMMLGGQFFRGSHFETHSLINYVLPKDKIWDKASQMAWRIAEKPRFALELLNRNLSISKRLAFEEARTHEAAMHQICFTHPETIQRIRDNYAPAMPGSR